MSTNVETNEQAPICRTLRRQVQEEQLPPAASATTKRLHDLHITAYPSSVNYTLLSERARNTHDVLTDAEAQLTLRSDKQGDSLARLSKDAKAAGVQATMSTMTTNGLTAQMRAMGIAMRKARAKDGASPTLPRSLRHAGLTYDQRTTYRLDYTVDGHGAATDQKADAEHESASLDSTAAHQPDYRASWSEQERRNVDMSMRLPYLTLPETCTHDKTTIYRRELIPQAAANDYRTVHHKLTRADLGMSFAYSAYSVDDARRRIDYDAAVASLREPRSALEDPHAADDKATAHNLLISRTSGKEQKAELDRLRALLRTEAARSATRRQQEPDADKLYSSFAPAGKTDYIYLPRDTFCPRKPSYL